MYGNFNKSIKNEIITEDKYFYINTKRITDSGTYSKFTLYESSSKKLIIKNLRIDIPTKYIKNVSLIIGGQLICKYPYELYHYFIPESLNKTSTSLNNVSNENILKINILKEYFCNDIISTIIPYLELFPVPIPIFNIGLPIGYYLRYHEVEIKFELNNNMKNPIHNLSYDLYAFYDDMLYDNICVNFEQINYHLSVYNASDYIINLFKNLTYTNISTISKWIVETIISSYIEDKRVLVLNNVELISKFSKKYNDKIMYFYDLSTITENIDNFVDNCYMISQNILIISHGFGGLKFSL